MELCKERQFGILLRLLEVRGSNAAEAMRQRARDKGSIEVKGMTFDARIIEKALKTWNCKSQGAEPQGTLGVGSTSRPLGTHPEIAESGKAHAQEPVWKAAVPPTASVVPDPRHLSQVIAASPQTLPQKPAALRLSFIVVGKKLGIRDCPSINSDAREAGYLSSGVAFEVSEVRDGEDGRKYLKLADGRGWVYDRSAKDFDKVVVQQMSAESEEVGRPRACKRPLQASVGTKTGKASVPKSASKAIKQIKSQGGGASGVSQAWVKKEWAILKKTHSLVGWSLVFDKAKRRLGVCKYKHKHVGVSSFMLKDPKTSEHQVKNTLLHEIAHALVGKEHSHDAVWKAKAVSIGCDGSRCGRGFESTPKPYEIRCKSGCWSVGRFRWQALGDVLKRPCTKCGGSLEYLFNGKPCKTKSKVKKYRLRCKSCSWAIARQRRQREAWCEKKRCPKCRGKIGFVRAR